jgi:hypothetical protein
MQLALDAIAFTASRRRLPLATNALRALMSDTVEVLASADTTALEKASSISLSLKFVIYKNRYLLNELNVRDNTEHKR